MSSAIADISSELVMGDGPECACAGNATGMDASPAATDNAIRRFSKRLALMPTLSHVAPRSAKGLKITIPPACIRGPVKRGTLTSTSALREGGQM